MRLAASGFEVFLDRYDPLLQHLTGFLGPIARVPSGNLALWWPMRIYNRVSRGTRFHDRLLRPDPNPAAFAIRSRQSERAIGRLRPRPDLVLQIFCSFAPVWRGTGPPFVLYLDFTMAQALRDYPPWSSFAGERRRRQWLHQERRTYQDARHIFVMGSAVRDSLRGDYDIPSERVTVVGSGGNFLEAYTGPKTFGTHRILFDGSVFDRKGGDILLEALARVRQVKPSTTLVIAGHRLPREIEGVDSLGPVTRRDAMRELFLSADLVVAPTRCDPFPGFIIEAMNYGVPSIVSTANGLAPILRAHAAGVVVDGLAPEAYAAAMLSLLDDPVRLTRLSDQGRRVVQEQLNWRSVAAAMAPILDRCASG